MSIEQRLIPATYVQFLAQEFPDPIRLLRGTNLTVDDLAPGAADISVMQILRCVRNADGMATRADWYLRYAQRMAEHFHGHVSVAWLAAPTLGDGLDIFVKHMPARVPYFRWHSGFEGDRFFCELTPLMDLGTYDALLTEIPLLVMHEYVNTIHGGTMDDACIELRHPAPAHHARYSAWFKCPVMFGAGRNAFTLPIAWRAARNAGYDELTWRNALYRLEAMAAPAAGSETLKTMRDHLSELWGATTSGGAPPTLQVFAAHLHVSARTLIRRLRRLGTTYHLLVDGIQRERASELLARPQLRIYEVAAALGYRDPASFGRSFKRWFGTTPGDFRRRLWAGQSLHTDGIGNERRRGRQRLG